MVSLILNFLMEHNQPVNIQIPTTNVSSSYSYSRSSSYQTNEDQQPSTSNISTSNSTATRADTHAHLQRTPFNSGFWISIELTLTVSQIVTSVIVLSLSENEQPPTPLFEWVVGYASACVATLPLLYCRYRHNSRLNVNAGPFSVSLTPSSEGDDDDLRITRDGQNARLKTLAEYFKMAMDCFFAVWFVVGNFRIFGGHSSAREAPNLYRLCIVFLTFTCIGYAMPIILCATICCCLPCIISVLGYREDLSHNLGATPESINALPTHKFKVKKDKSSSDNAGDRGVVAAGTEKERVISGEDAVCCICLTNYTNNDELRELPCSHFFHKECVDKWLKINALCPLCKSEVGESLSGFYSGLNSGLRQIESGVRDVLASNML